MTSSLKPDPHTAVEHTNAPAREPMPANFNPFWRFLGLLFLLTLCIGGVSAIIGLALSD